ncbi:sensor histidine kinase KdpD [Oceanicella sp. SM1341]|uniref:sensor histidine kinase n=1 Tax=Oceanicella sp. SM1341 TaxID=1548889 RepID=UPI000E5357E2|nr:HAMP domain-containing sensor histidine kinase [Oceanicella sp. SM1341]
MHRRWRLSLRMRLVAAAGLIALAALAGAGLAAWGVGRISTLIALDKAAEARLDSLAMLSARVGEFAVVAMEGVTVPTPEAERRARLETRGTVVDAAFARVAAGMGADVAAGRTEVEQMRRASRSIGLARMRATFAALAREAAGTADSGTMRSLLDGFATRFSPLLNQAIEEDRRARDEVGREITALGQRLRRLAAGAALFAAAALAGFYVLLVRPLSRRLQRVADAAAAIGRSDARLLPPDRRDELGLVLAQINRAAARVRRRRAAVDRDRARLETLVSDRTAELSAANARLERVDSERRRFFSDVGHELRTPLTVILAEADIGAAEPPLPEAEAKAGFRLIGQRARRLARRIDDLLRIARSESGRIELVREPFDLAPALADAIEDASPLARRQGVEIEARLAPGLTVEGDRDWLRQVASGVIDNAVRHAPRGSTITVAAGPRGDRMEATITDRGEGVPMSDQQRIFTRHARGSDARAGTGFGVGLALAAWVMEQHGGEITLESPVEEGRGTRVTLALPPAGAEGGR